MRSTNIDHSFEINICNLLKPTSVKAVFQSINTLPSGDILKVSSCHKNTVVELIRYCQKSGNTLLRKIYVDGEITLFIKKN